MPPTIISTKASYVLMGKRRGRVRRAAVGAMIGLGANTLRAQTPGPMPTPAMRVWISGGFGAGTSPHGALAGIASLWYSAGPVAFGGRLAGANQLFGEQRGDQAFLIGWRAGGNRAFVLGAAGIGHVSSSRTCDGPCDGDITRPTTNELAYTLEAHGSLGIAGLGLVAFGAAGPPSSRYGAVAVTVDVGWFGP